MSILDKLGLDKQEFTSLEREFSAARLEQMKEQYRRQDWTQLFGYLLDIDFASYNGQPTHMFIDPVMPVAIHLANSPQIGCNPKLPRNMFYPFALIWPELLPFNMQEAANIVERAAQKLIAPVGYVEKKFYVMFDKEMQDMQSANIDGAITYHGLVSFEVDADAMKRHVSIMQAQLAAWRRINKQD